ncbi:hypothetical protein P3S67_015792 [Capsicum chacoense]
MNLLPYPYYSQTLKFFPIFLQFQTSKKPSSSSFYYTFNIKSSALAYSRSCC